jgi:replicative DNA helicase
MPAAGDAEVGLICSAFLNSAFVRPQCEEANVSREFFFTPSCAILFELIQEFWAENEPLEDVAFMQTLRDRGLMEHLGGRIRGEQWSREAFYTAVRTFIPTPYDCASYIEILKEKYILRQVIQTCTDGAARGYQEQDDVPKLLNDTIERMMKIVRLAEGQKTHARSMMELVKLAMSAFDDELENPGKIEMPSGIPSLDFYTDGFIAPEVTLIMGAPSDGKSALAFNVAEHLAVNRGKRVGIISLEMGDIQVAKRLILARAAIDWRAVKRRQPPGLTEEEFQRMATAGKELEVAPIYIRDDGGLTVGEINATAAAWKAKHGLDLLIIDHAQLAKSDGRTDGRTEEVEAVSNAMKPMAKRLNVPIILLSQVTKSSDGASYSAKNSKALEADADNIWTLTHKREEDETGRKVITESWITLNKQRDRERFVTVHLVFNERLQRFAEKVKEPEAEQPDLIAEGYPSSKRKKNR